MRGFETLLAASVATAGIAQIAVMVARAPHVNAVSVAPPVSTCCQYRTWPVEHSFWTFPIGTEFHLTGGAPLPNRPTSIPFAVPVTPAGDPPPDLLYSPTGHGSGPLVARNFPWIDLVAEADAPTASATNDTAQNGSATAGIGQGPATAADAHPPVPAPQMNLFLVDPGPGDEEMQAQTPSFVGTSPPPQLTPDILAPIPRDLSDGPPTQIAGNPGGPDNGAPGGTSPADVPEPAALILMLTSLLGLAALRHGQRA